MFTYVFHYIQKTRQKKAIAIREAYKTEKDGYKW